LNKFNIIDHHLLIVTRTFKEQETWLTLQDFEAMWACLNEIDGLVFYNGGKTAGASQRHKHLQLVPLPLVEEGLKIPIEPAIASVIFQDSIGHYT
jgi:ATP adenylyltransferase